MLDDETATLVLCGSDEDKLRRLQSNIFWPSELIIHESEEDLAHQLLQMEGVFHGMVCNAKVSDAVLKSIAFDDYASIVILHEEGSETPCTTLKLEESRNIRVNQIIYQSNKMEFVLDDWSALFLEKGLPREMLLPNYLGNSVIWLLGKDSKYISGSTINISEMGC